MKVGTIQKSYGFDTSGTICMSDRKLIEWCVASQLRSVNVHWRSLSRGMLGDVIHFTKMENLMPLEFYRERKKLESEDRFLWQRRISAFRLIFLIIDYIQGDSFVSEKQMNVPIRWVSNNMFFAGKRFRQ